MYIYKKTEAQTVIVHSWRTRFIGTFCPSWYLSGRLYVWQTEYEYIFLFFCSFQGFNVFLMFCSYCLGRLFSLCKVLELRIGHGHRFSLFLFPPDLVDFILEDHCADRLKQAKHCWYQCRKIRNWKYLFTCFLDIFSS